MPVLDSLPDPDTIKRMKGQLDYYIWRGLPIVRKWPYTPLSHITNGTRQQSDFYSSWLRRAKMTDAAMMAEARRVSQATNWTWRDFVCFAIAGNLYNP